MPKPLLFSSFPIVAAIAVIAVIPGSSAHAGGERQKQAADQHLARGLAHYEARDFEAAITAFLAGYALDPRPHFLFALGQAERLSGDCPSALVYYEGFLATRPPAEQVRAARMHIQGCRQALASAPIVAVAGEGDAALASSADAGPSAWYRDAVGDVLLGAGVASVVAGIGFLITSEKARAQAGHAATYPEYDLYTARAQRHQRWSAVALGAGASLAVAAVYRFHTRPGAGGREARELAVAPAPGGATLSYGGRF